MTDLLADTHAAEVTRAEAISRGSLRDVTADARNFGILLPTAIADRAWKQAIAWPDLDTATRWETDRTWTVLAHAARAPPARSGRRTRRSPAVQLNPGTGAPRRRPAHPRRRNQPR